MSGMRGGLDERFSSASSHLEAGRESAQRYDSYTPTFRSDQGYRGNYDPRDRLPAQEGSSFAQRKKLSAATHGLIRLGYQTVAYGPAVSGDTRLKLAMSCTTAHRTPRGERIRAASLNY
nr:hypothetical protein B0A51_00129 [Rachicladosporium sp. CCFEE 5018]